MKIKINFLKKITNNNNKQIITKITTFYRKYALKRNAWGGSGIVETVWDHGTFLWILRNPVFPKIPLAPTIWITFNFVKTQVHPHFSMLADMP